MTQRAITFQEDDKKAWVRYARHLRRVWSWLPQRHELLEKIVKHVRPSNCMTAADRKAFTCRSENETNFWKVRYRKPINRVRSTFAIAM